jgi:hypothetical protein
VGVIISSLFVCMPKILLFCSYMWKHHVYFVLAFEPNACIDVHQCNYYTTMKTGLGSTASPKQRQRNDYVSTDKTNQLYLFLHANLQGRGCYCGLLQWFQDKEI